MRELGDRMLATTCGCYRFESGALPAGGGKRTEACGLRVARIVRNVGVAPATADSVVLDREVHACVNHARTLWRGAAGLPREAHFRSRAGRAEAARVAR